MKVLPHVTGITGSGHSAKLSSCHTQQQLQKTLGETTWLKEQDVYIALFYKCRRDVVTKTAIKIFNTFCKFLQFLNSFAYQDVHVVNATKQTLLVLACLNSLCGRAN